VSVIYRAVLRIHRALLLVFLISFKMHISPRKRCLSVCDTSGSFAGIQGSFAGIQGSFPDLFFDFIQFAHVRLPAQEVSVCL